MSERGNKKEMLMVSGLCLVSLGCSVFSEQVDEAILDQWFIKRENIRTYELLPTTIMMAKITPVVEV